MRRLTIFWENKMRIKAICNTSPIIGLSIVGRIDLLWELFDIYIPQEVYNEVVIEVVKVQLVRVS
jgi:predicted nucleic acid-binding protein